MKIKSYFKHSTKEECIDSLICSAERQIAQEGNPEKIIKQFQEIIDSLSSCKKFFELKK